MRKLKPVGSPFGLLTPTAAAPQPQVVRLCRELNPKIKMYTFLAGDDPRTTLEDECSLARGCFVGSRSGSGAGSRLPFLQVEGLSKAAGFLLWQ